jgi:hypothetical protein
MNFAEPQIKTNIKVNGRSKPRAKSTAVGQECPTHTVNLARHRRLLHRLAGLEGFVTLVDFVPVDYVPPGG